MELIELVKLVAPVSAILVVGLFFGFEHIKNVREYTRKVRSTTIPEFQSEVGKLDKSYKNNEKVAYTCLLSGIGGFILSILISVLSLSIDLVPNNIWFLIIMIIFTLSNISIIVFAIYLKKLVSIVK